MEKDTTKPIIRTEEEEEVKLVRFVIGFFVFLYRRAIRP